MVFFNSNNMMGLKPNAAPSTFMVSVAALLACVVIPLVYCCAEGRVSGGVDKTTFPSLPIPMVAASSNSVWVVGFSDTFIPRNLPPLVLEPSRSEVGVGGESLVDLTPVVVRGVPRLISHSFDRRVVILGQSFIPGRTGSKLFRPVRWRVPPFVNWGPQPFAPSSVGGKWGKGFATTTMANRNNTLFLQPGCSHNSSDICPIHYTGKLEESNRKPRELLGYPEGTTSHSEAGNGGCEGLKIVCHGAISSQASGKPVEGSTTRVRSLNRIGGMAVKPHECAARKGRYSLISRETARGDINSRLSTQMNSVPFTGKLDDLSKHPVTQIIHQVLKDDANETMEAAAHSQWDATLLVVTPASGTSETAITIEVAGTATATNNVALGNSHVKLIVDEMKERKIPAFDGSNYGCIGRPSTFRSFKDDLEALSVYTDRGYGDVLNGEVGRSYDGVRFFEQTSIESEGWSNGKSDAAYFFGADTVVEGIAIPEEIRGKIPTDFGRSKGVAWYSLNGFGIVHNQTGAEQNRIIKWASAA